MIIKNMNNDSQILEVEFDDELLKDLEISTKKLQLETDAKEAVNLAKEQPTRKNYN